MHFSKAGAKIDEPHRVFSPTTAHLLPTELMKPNTDIYRC